MAVVALNGDLLNTLIRSRFPHGVEQLLDRWNARDTGQPDAGRSIPDRSTVYRWIDKGNLPRSRNDFLTICSLLDVDPLCLLVAADGDTPKALEYLLSSLQLDHWKQPALRFLSSFFGRQHGWPPVDFVQQFYGRSWHTAEIEHDPKVRANYYATIELTGSANVYDRRPQVFHFAFRLPTLFRQRWLEFGIVQRFGDEVRLFHINGHNDTYVSKANVSHVESWFGPGPAIFRLASLHPFSATIAQQLPAEAPRVRFPG